MKIRRIKSLKVNSSNFTVKWDKSIFGASASYTNQEIIIGIDGNDDDMIFSLICHELMEIAAIEMNVRFNRPDCTTDFMFIYDHRQHDTMMYMFAGLLTQFIG